MANFFWGMVSGGALTGAGVAIAWYIHANGLKDTIKTLDLKYQAARDAVIDYEKKLGLRK